MATIITEQAQAGYIVEHPATYSGGTNPHLWSSANWFGFEAGRAMGRCAYTKPIKATMGRGYQVNVWTASNRFLVTFDAKLAPRVERLGQG